LVSGYTKSPTGDYSFPQLAAEQGYHTAKNIILTIRGTNYKIKVNIEDPENPQEGSLELHPTSEPATPFLPVVPTDERMNAICDQYLEDKDGLTAEELTDYHAYIGSSNYEVYAFGQPRFIQGATYPSYNGKAVYQLICLENGWGDCGNVNIFIALENDKPVAAFIEASCC
jgi:hypothetical protein